MQPSELSVRIGSSRTGLGVFATRRYRSAETIGEVCGQLVDDSDYQSDYCMELTRTLSLEPAAPFRFVNHSCRPNCALVMVETCNAGGAAGLRQLWLQSLADIQPGEQLTIDYAWPAEAAIPCRCGSKHCRGWIVAKGDLHLLCQWEQAR